jgi:hypothetical protein
VYNKIDGEIQDYWYFLWGIYSYCDLKIFAPKLLRKLKNQAKLEFTGKGNARRNLCL